MSDVIEIDQKKSEFVNLDELIKSTVQKMVKKIGRQLSGF